MTKIEGVVLELRAKFPCIPDYSEGEPGIYAADNTLWVYGNEQDIMCVDRHMELYVPNVCKRGGTYISYILPEACYHTYHFEGGDYGTNY